VTRAAILLALAACGGGGDNAPDAPPPELDAAAARETIMETQTLQPGELVEGIMTGGTGDAAQIHLVAPMQLDWNIHSHATGSTVTVHEEYEKAMVDYNFVPTATGDWYLLVKNSGNVTAGIQVRVGLFGAMAWRWQ
jgi:hypothetical protein